MDNKIAKILTSEIERLDSQINSLKIIKKTHSSNSNEYVRLGGKIEGVKLCIENMRQTINTNYQR